MTRAVVAADRRLLVALLGPGQVARRVADLERTRALAVDDAAAQLRRVERDLHDGAQIRLATLAMHLGQARRPWPTRARPTWPGPASGRRRPPGRQAGPGRYARPGRGIHPPALDSGLDNALATLAATSAVPVGTACDLRERPDPAIETIAYYCAAGLANAAKHSRRPGHRPGRRAPRRAGPPGRRRRRRRRRRQRPGRPGPAGQPRRAAADRQPPRRADLISVHLPLRT